jgi:hypothetical protein
MKMIDRRRRAPTDSDHPIVSYESFEVTTGISTTCAELHELGFPGGMLVDNEPTGRWAGSAHGVGLTSPSIGL